MSKKKLDIEGQIGVEYLQNDKSNISSRAFAIVIQLLEKQPI